MYKHKKIVLTGGPCAGKTTAMQRIVEEFTEKGYKVFVICETATELINGGIKAFGNNSIDMVDFQDYVLELQLSKEKLYEKVANSYLQDTIVLCDRGALDGRAYTSSVNFKNILKRKKLNEMDLLMSYDLVIHLVTAADGAREFYTLSNNAARSENIEEAVLADRKTLNSWLGHPKIEIISNGTTFDDKICNTIVSIYQELGDPYPIQKQYKFLVESIDFSKLKDNQCVELDLIQFFSGNRMFRKTTKDDFCSYSLTYKKNTTNPSERITLSRNISEKEYLDKFKSLSFKPIYKKRYCFTYNKQYYKLDVFNNFNNLMILEVVLTNKNKTIKIPDFINISEEVTNDIKYRNINIYKEINK